MPPIRSQQTFREEIAEAQLRRSNRIRETKLRKKNKELRTLRENINITNEKNDRLEQEIATTKSIVKHLELQAASANRKLLDYVKRDGLGEYGDFLAIEVAAFRPHFEDIFVNSEGRKPPSTANDMATEIFKENEPPSSKVLRTENTARTDNVTPTDSTSTIDNAAPAISVSTADSVAPGDMIPRLPDTKFQLAVNEFLKEQWGLTVYNNTPAADVLEHSEKLRTVILMYRDRNKYSHNSVFELSKEKQLPILADMIKDLGNRPGFTEKERAALIHCIGRYRTGNFCKSKNGEWEVHKPEVKAMQASVQKKSVTKQLKTVKRQLYRRSIGVTRSRSVPPTVFPTGNLERGERWMVENEMESGEVGDNGDSKDIHAGGDDQAQGEEWINMNGFEC
jgi:hypothetical protein